MSDIAIHVEHLGKCYRIHQRAAYDTFQEAIINAASAPFRKLKRGSNSNSGDPHSFWALKDVSFDVENGDVLGIIGRNGSGKSTLLKILSRITVPTEGRAEIHGRVGSLLEVGTGFHPELTGRENIYLSGSILGMSKREIDDKFDGIVRFSEVKKFLDTPVKHYSSGMHVRLAFAVAAHLDPEILLIDEVLAVGDAAFQKKCLGKMRNVANEGRTVLFVSHNMGAVSELCEKCIHLEQGRIFAMGDAKSVVGEYLSSGSLDGEVDLRNWSLDRVGKGPMRIMYLATKDTNGKTCSQFVYGQPIIFEFEISGIKGAECSIGLSIRNRMGNVIHHFSNRDDKYELRLSESESAIQMRLNNIILNDGKYFITLRLGDSFGNLNDRVGNCLAFTVDSSIQGKVRSKGLVRIPAVWTQS